MPKVFLIRRSESSYKSFVKKDKKQTTHVPLYPTCNFYDGCCYYDFQNFNHNDSLRLLDEKLNYKNYKLDLLIPSNFDYVTNTHLTPKVEKVSTQDQSNKDLYSCDSKYVQHLPRTSHTPCASLSSFSEEEEEEDNSKTPKPAHTLTSFLSPSSQKPFACSTCGKSFRLSSTLCRHKIIHTTDRPHTCRVCKKCFNRSSTLKTHMRTHNKTKEFVCPTCNKGFHQKGNLRNHVLIHTGEKPYACKVCSKAFNKLSNLKFHMHIHTDQKPYRCRFCKLSMTRRGELKHHIKMFHPEDV